MTRIIENRPLESPNSLDFHSSNRLIESNYDDNCNTFDLCKRKPVIQPFKQREYHPYLHHLSKIDWLIFGTVTWDRSSRRGDTAKAQWQRQQDFRDMINAMCGRLKLRPKKVAYYWALEYGKANECHFHFLIARNGLERRSAVLCADTLTTLWKDSLTAFDSNRKGFGEQVDIRPYDQAENHPAVKYCLKVERDFKGDEKERYDFLSPRLMKLIKRQNELPMKNDFLLKPLIPKKEERELLI